jgi:hypothetical protein
MYALPVKQGVWAAHRTNSRGEQQEVTAKAEGAAIHLGWVGLERVDSTVGGLFGAIIAVLAASASAELQALPVVIKLDNKGVVDHFNQGGLEPKVRQRLKQHARALWNVLHYLLSGPQPQDESGIRMAASKAQPGHHRGH